MDSQLHFAVTSDGSKTLFNAAIGEHYHSRHGALQESRHVFIESGFRHLMPGNPSRVNILEVGFGTGLNFLLSAEYSLKNRIPLRYTGIEAFPLSTGLISQTGYDSYVSQVIWDSFLRSYEDALKEETNLAAGCSLRIIPLPLMEFETSKIYDLIYFDAFAAVHQPDMWTEATLSHVCRYLRPGGIFVTYAITGNLKRIMKALGFRIEKIPGAPGKREMLRAMKEEDVRY